MSQTVPSEDIERIVGAVRHSVRHIARAVSAEQTVYILHSQMCRDTYPDLRECPFSLALDNGIDAVAWSDMQDRALRVMIVDGRLVPVHNGGLDR